MEEIEHRATPARELRYENDINLAGLGQSEDLLPYYGLGSGAESHI